MRASYEKVLLGQDESFRVRSFALPAFDSPYHFHPELELTLILASHGTRFVGDSIQPFMPGDLVLLGPNLPHYWYNQPSDTGPEPDAARSIVVQFSRDVLGTPFMQLPEMWELESLFARSARGLRFLGAVRDRVEAAMADLLEVRGLPRMTGLINILADLARAPSGEVTELAGVGYLSQLSLLDTERLDRLHQYVLRHLTEPMTLGEAARLVHLSPAAFCRYFKRHTGKTFISFVNELRVGRACRLLIETDRDIGSIAEASGFTNLSNFNRRFRQITSLSPREYRQLHGS